MIKCIDKGKWTCISRNNTPKKSYPTADIAIRAAKCVNDINLEKPTKLVAYKCTYCFKYHLVTVFKNKKKLSVISKY